MSIAKSEIKWLMETRRGASPILRSSINLAIQKPALKLYKGEEGCRQSRTAVMLLHRSTWLNIACKIGGDLGEDFRRWMLWVRTVYARFGLATLVFALALFAAAPLSDSQVLRYLAFTIGGALVLLVAADLARSLLERDKVPLPPRYLPVTPLQIVLTVVQAGIYTWFIFAALGELTPFGFIAPVFGLSSIVAWRNVRLWYRHSLDYEEHLKEAEEIEKLRRARAHWRDNER
jgi:hypothetical protein